MKSVSASPAVNCTPDSAIRGMETLPFSAVLTIAALAASDVVSVARSAVPEAFSTVSPMVTALAAGAASPEVRRESAVAAAMVAVRNLTENLKFNFLLSSEGDCLGGEPPQQVIS